MANLIPRQAVPELSVDTLQGERWTLSKQRPENFTLLVFYRGLHCPLCKLYLRELDRQLDEFRKRGIEVLALSSDSEERARRSYDDWGLKNLTLGHGLSIDRAREWGLYVSTGIGTSSVGVEEPDLFSEPGLFLVRPDGTLYAAIYQTMPFARPNFAELLKSLDIIIEKNYPARGEA